MQLEKLESCIDKTMKKSVLSREVVISACDRISKNMESGVYDPLLADAGLTDSIDEEMKKEAIILLSADFLRQKVAAELGPDPNRVCPLGVLLHIGAGNVHGLAAYSIIEGLLTGNINLVKLASDDSGISGLLIAELVKTEPLLQEYIYLFELSSEQTEEISKLARLADAVAVWGGADTIKSIRTIVEPDVRLIEWGHKMSFAYVTAEGATDENLAQLAGHILRTRQRYCTSCQGIYINSQEDTVIEEFCRKFLGFLEAAAAGNQEFDSGWTGKNTVSRYTYQLEHRDRQVKVFTGNAVSLLYPKENTPEPYLSEGNLWVRALPFDRIMNVVRPVRGYLHTVGLLCGSEERQALSAAFIRAGFMRVRSAGDMSAVYAGDAHDGDYPLRRYSKLVNAGFVITLSSGIESPGYRW